MGWSHFSDEQAARVRKAARYVLESRSAGAGEIEALREEVLPAIESVIGRLIADENWDYRLNGPKQDLAEIRRVFPILRAHVDSLTAPAPGVQTEARCDDCGGVNPVWFAPNPLWNLVMGGPDCIADPGGFICPRCFIVRAQALNDFAGVVWKLVPESETDWAEAERIQALMRSPAPGVREAMEEADLGFMPPLRFEFAQSSDQSGEHYTSLARFVDAKGHVIIDITPNGDWVDTQMHFIADLLTRARLSSLPAAGKTR